MIRMLLHNMILKENQNDDLEPFEIAKDIHIRQGFSFANFKQNT